MMIALMSSYINHQLYVDDLNIIGTELDINKAQDRLKTEFEMKDLVKTKFCLGL
jgi:hypothetical protein